MHSASSPRNFGRRSPLRVVMHSPVSSELLWYFKPQIPILRIYICLESGTHKHNSFKNKAVNNLTILSEFLYKNIFFNTMSIEPLRGSKLL